MKFSINVDVPLMIEMLDGKDREIGGDPVTTKSITKSEADRLDARGFLTIFRKDVGKNVKTPNGYVYKTVKRKFAALNEAGRAKAWELERAAKKNPEPKTPQIIETTHNTMDVRGVFKLTLAELADIVREIPEAFQAETHVTGEASIHHFKSTVAEMSRLLDILNDRTKPKENQKP